MTAPLSLRINSKLKDRLLAEAFKSNKSLSRLVEDILDREKNRLDKIKEDLKLIV